MSVRGCDNPATWRHFRVRMRRPCLIFSSIIDRVIQCYKGGRMWNLTLPCQVLHTLFASNGRGALGSCLLHVIVTLLIGSVWKIEGVRGKFGRGGYQLKGAIACAVICEGRHTWLRWDSTGIDRLELLGLLGIRSLRGWGCWVLLDRALAALHCFFFPVALTIQWLLIRFNFTFTIYGLCLYHTCLYLTVQLLLLLFLMLPTRLLLL